jgi:hypothetical protein
VAPTPTPTVSGVDAIIVFTGSFQFGPFEIDQFSDGVAVVTQSTGQNRQIVPLSIVRTFFHDLAQNVPVDQIPVGSCPKPTTAPTDETTLTYQGKTSGDISCPGNNAKTKKLYSDVVAIENALGLRSKLRSRHPL